jgi:dynamin 1-like protein
MYNMYNNKMEGDGFAGSFYNNLRALVTLVDHLRDAGLQKYIKLPRIVTLGVQSSGKSSVLESIVGLNFLPRGEGVCTRRPLELRLVHVYDDTKPYAVFESVAGQLTDFDKVRETIEKLTDQKAGRNKGIVDDPIVLTIYSSTCPDLTLIDLPGITRIPLAGSDQPDDIERITKEMAYRYISDPRTIILCVIPANTDLSTSEGLMMARKVDPQGLRTVGVITKIDIMDRGTNARRVLEGKEIPLRLGYVGVKNRSQEDISNRVRVENALNEEREFFSKHLVYSTMPPGYLGTEVLSNKLTKVLFTHIKHILPEILKETLHRIKDCEDRLQDLGPSAPIEPRQKTQLIWNMVTDYCEIFKNIIRGKFDRRKSSKITKDLSGGATIKSYFNNLLDTYAGNYKCTDEYSDKDIQKAMQMHEGDNIPGFPSVDVFMFLLQPQLEQLKLPVLDCLADVHSHLEQLAHKIIERVFYRFPTLAGELSEQASQILMKEKEECRVIVESIIDAEEGYIFTNDLEYLTKRTDIIPKAEGKAVRDAESVFVQEIRSRIDVYFSLVVRNVRDTVPKVIGYFLVRSVMDKMQMHLYEFINQNELVLNLVSEPAHISTERDALRKQLVTLRKAEKILKHDPSMASQAEAYEEEIKQQELALQKKEDESKRKIDDSKEEELIPPRKEAPASSFSNPAPVEKRELKPVPDNKAQFATAAPSTSLFGDFEPKRTVPSKSVSKDRPLF